MVNGVDDGLVVNGNRNNGVMDGSDVVDDGDSLVNDGDGVVDDGDNDGLVNDFDGVVDRDLMLGSIMDDGDVVVGFFVMTFSVLSGTLVVLNHMMRDGGVMNLAVSVLSMVTVSVSVSAVAVSVFVANAVSTVSFVLGDTVVGLAVIS